MKDNQQNLLIGMDFNAKIGQERTIIWEDDRNEIGRKQEKIERMCGRIGLDQKSIGVNRSKLLQIVKEPWLVSSNKDRNVYGRRSNVYINIKSKRLLEEVEKRGWDILNGNIEEDEERELTYIGAHR